MRERQHGAYGVEREREVGEADEYHDDGHARHAAPPRRPLLLRASASARAPSAAARRGRVAHVVGAKGGVGPHERHAAADAPDRPVRPR